MLTLIILAALAAIVLAFVVWRYERGVIDFIVRFRTWIVVVTAELILVLPDALGTLNADPDFVAVVPEHWRHWIGVAALVLTLWSRFRPATRSSDAEVKVAKTLKTIDAPAAAVVVRPVNAEPIHVATVATGSK